MKNKRKLKFIKILAYSGEHAIVKLSQSEYEVYYICYYREIQKGLYRKYNNTYIEKKGFHSPNETSHYERS